MKSAAEFGIVLCVLFSSLVINLLYYGILESIQIHRKFQYLLSNCLNMCDIFTNIVMHRKVKKGITQIQIVINVHVHTIGNLDSVKVVCSW